MTALGKSSWLDEKKLGVEKLYHGIRSTDKTNTHNTHVDGIPYYNTHYARRKVKSFNNRLLLSYASALPTIR